MVQSQAPTVDAYLVEASPRYAPILQQLRGLARRVLHDHDERMQWGMPVYVRRGRISFGFAEQKQYLTLYFVNSAALEKNVRDLAGVSRGKACLRFRRSAAVDWGLVEKLLVDTRDSEPPARH
jgi:uncharacterized protein YdhG (YjbR/CyaY superfamily)